MKIGGLLWKLNYWRKGHGWPTIGTVLAAEARMEANRLGACEREVLLRIAHAKFLRKKLDDLDE